ncbi:U11/U12 small nuclear ribonucleoprotein 48 kDa protein-like [Agrilus planipennis]|uniref:U11/U12 small nuclear ribonucleoprotein 48 kDa protein-like n=1 Tax=Agrilus planipennis TaxID=224129 RepID=A0A1W4WEA0_AGRPL|nr:U11/U12 small nuclear ribonucleoprotein 48 kDa protein-like [Agrilus planipennis]
MYYLRVLIYTRFFNNYCIIMDFNIQVRKKQLLNLEQFIFTSKDKVHSILDCLGWNVKEVLKEKTLVNCPLDLNHKIAEKNVSSHTETCYLKREGYALNENFLSEPLHDPQASLYIENGVKMAIFNEASQRIPNFRRGWNGRDRDPKTADRLMSTFSNDERTALYEYVISRTKGPIAPPEFNINEPNESVENKTLTEEELLIRKRDARRRRIKYKAVHTNKKSYKEVLREVIGSQMEMYKDWLQEGRIRGCRTPEGDPDDPDNQNNEQLSESNEHPVDGSSQDRSYASDVLYDYPCDNSLTSRGSNHSESSKGSKQRGSRKYDHERDEYRNSYKKKRDEYVPDGGCLKSRDGSYEKDHEYRSRSCSKISSDERKHDKYNNYSDEGKGYNEHHYEKYRHRHKEPYSHHNGRYDEKYERTRRHRSRSRSKYSSSSLKKHRYHSRNH